MESFDPIFFAVIPAGAAGMVSGWCDMRADMRPGAEGKTLYRVAATLCGLATVATSVMIFVPAFSLSDVMLIAFCAVYTWQLALLAASSACKARLGARLKRFGDIRFFQQGQTIRAAQDAALRQSWHPRGWLPFYHPWRQYRRKTITRSEFAAACLAHAALITLALWLPIEVDRVDMAACYFLIANGFFLSANALGKDGPDTAQASRKRTLYATSSLLFSVYFIALAALNTYLATLTEAFFADLLADLQEEGISRQALRELYFLPDIGLPVIAAALCCIPFFVVLQVRARERAPSAPLKASACPCASNKRTDGYLQKYVVSLLTKNRSLHSLQKIHAECKFGNIRPIVKIFFDIFCKRSAFL